MNRYLRCFAAAIVAATTAHARALAQSPPSSTWRPLDRLTDAVKLGRASLSGPLGARIAISYDAVPLAKALDDIARRSGLSLGYADDLRTARAITVAPDTVTAAEALLRVTRGTGWTPWVDAEGQIAIRRDGARRAANVPGAVRVSGFVRRADSREIIRYANIVAERDSVRTQSSTDGSFFLQVGPGPQRLRVRALGFVARDTTIDGDVSQTIEIELVPIAASLGAVQVEAKQERSDIDPSLPEMSVSRLDLATIKQVPAVLGEVDPIRSLTLLPGVSRTSDFSTAFTVRGGGPDQNLILLDESVVYNPAHVLGILSVFNSDAIDDVTLYKGAIPVRYGGRLSSVLDVRQREGNAKEFGGSAAIGLLASRALVEGPLPWTRGSFLIAGRRSYADAFLSLASDTTLKKTRAYFYDVNAKLNIPLGATGMLMLSSYSGRDAYGQSNNITTWGNRSTTLRWNQIVANRLFSKVSINTSDYDYRLGFKTLDTPINWTSQISSTLLKIDESWAITEGQKLEFGLEGGALSVKPGNLGGPDSTKVRPVNIAERRALSVAAYIGHSIEFGERVSLKYGMRWAGFERRGPGTTYTYVGGEPVRWDVARGRFEPGVLLDSIKTTGNGALEQFGGWEPRVGLRIGIDATSSLKASYSRTRQYLLLASRTTSPTPLDVWEPAGRYLKPQTSDQIAVGYAATVAGGRYEVSIEGYGKRLTNVADFVDGSDVLLNPQIETAIIQGEGRAYGAEFFVRRLTGSVTGWISYTLGRAQQRAAFGGGGINDGRWYPSPTDKTHDLSIVALKPLNDRWTLGSTFSLASGLPVTYPVSRYAVDGVLLSEFGPRNSARLPLYNRLDFSLTRTTRRGELQFGIYNILNRHNAQSMTFRQVQNVPNATEAVQLSIFGILPSVSYTWHF